MSKFLFIVSLWITFSSVYGLNFFNDCMGCVAESITEFNDAEYNMYGYYMDNSTISNPDQMHVIVDDYDMDKFQSQYSIQIADDMTIGLSEMYFPQMNVPIQTKIETVCPKPIRLYFVDSDDEEIDNGSDNVCEIRHTNTPDNTRHFRVTQYGFPFSIWSDYDEEDVVNMLEMGEVGTSSAFYSKNAEFDCNVDDHFLGGELSDVFSDVFIQNSTLKAVGNLNQAKSIIDEKSKLSFHNEFFNLIKYVLQSFYFMDSIQNDDSILNIKLSNKNAIRGYFIEFSVTQ